MNPSTPIRRPGTARNQTASKEVRDDIPNLTPNSIKRISHRKEGSFILNNIEPSTFQVLKHRYPELPGFRYEYDGLRESMTINYVDSRIHDSVYVFFVRRIKEEVYELERECCNEIQIKEFTKFTGFMGNYERRGSIMAPDAYVTIGDSVFPTIVMTVVWSESMDDVMANAKMWLLGTGFATKVVMIVHVTEDKSQVEMESGGEFSTRNSWYSSNHYGHPGITATGITSSHPNIPTPDNRAGYLEEQTLLANVSSTSDANELSQAILALHQRQALSRPLIHPINAKLRVFRVHDTGQGIYEEMRTTILPQFERRTASIYVISFGDLYGDHPIPSSVNPDGDIDFDLEELREDLEDQISTIERVRAEVRAKAILKAKRAMKPMISGGKYN